MIYLSRLVLNPLSRMVQREVGNPYQLHRTVMRGFHVPRGEGGILHRLDLERNGEIVLLVQSAVEPEWARLEEAGQGRYLLQPPQWKRVEARLPAGRALRFRLRANPTVKKKRGEHKHSNRVPLVREERQIEWLQRKGEMHGFTLRRATASRDEQQKDWIAGEGGRHRLTLYTVLFDGILQVTEADAFHTAWRNGIGPARAFGCGLLSLAPA